MGLEMRLRGASGRESIVERDEAIERRAEAILARGGCDWIDAWARAEQEIAGAQLDGAVDRVATRGRDATQRQRSAGRVTLSSKIGEPPALRARGAAAPGRINQTARLHAGGRTAGGLAVMRRAERAEVDAEAATLVERARRDGTPLDARLRRELEVALGTRLDDIRIHTGPDADAAARALGARAFAEGQDVFFRDGAYAPSRREGAELIAHEVAHAVQARSASRPEPGVLSVSLPDEPGEREAEAFASAFILGLHGVGETSAAEGARVDPRWLERVQRGGGAGLHGPVRERLEQALGTDLSDVRVHTGPSADAAARDIGAAAFTIGRDIHFARGRFDPATAAGQSLLAHEVVHAVQQRPAVADRRSPAISRPGDAHEIEAERFASDFAHGGERPMRVSTTAREVVHRAPADAAPPPSSGGAAPRPEGAHEGTPEGAPEGTPEGTINAHGHEAGGGAQAARDHADAAAAPGHPAQPLDAAGQAASTQPKGTGDDHERHASPDHHAPAHPGHTGDGDHAAPHPADGDHTAPHPADGDHAAPHPARADHASPAEGAAAPLASPPVASVAGPVAAGTRGVAGENPALAAARERIQTATATARARITSTADTRSQGLAAAANQQTAAIEAAGAAQARALLAQIDAKARTLAAHFAQARATLVAQIASQKAQARAGEQTARAGLRTLIAAKQRAARTAVSTEASAADAAGRSQAERTNGALHAAESSIHAARTRAESSIGSSDEKVRSGVRGELDKAENQNLGDLRSKARDTASAATQTMGRIAQGIRTHGERLVTQIGARATDVEQQIQRSTRQLVQDIDQQGRDALQRLAEGEQRARGGFAQARARVQPAVAAATQAVTGRLRVRAAQGAQMIAAEGRQSAANVDAAGADAMTKLAAVGSHDVAATELQRFTGQVVTNLGAMAQQGAAALDRQGESGQQGVAQVGQSFGQTIAAAAQRVDAATAHVVAGATEADELPRAFQQGCDRARQQTAEGNRHAVDEYGRGLDQRIGDGQRGFRQERTRGEDKVRGKVDEFVAASQRISREAPARFATVARNAAADAQRSLLSRIFSGILDGIKRFFVGLGIFALVILAIVAVIVVILVAAGAEILVAIAIAIVLVIEFAAIIGLVVGVVLSLISRIASIVRVWSQRPWWQNLLSIVALPFVVVGDAFGVSPILEGMFGYDFVTFEHLSVEERSARVTVGLLTIATMFLLHVVGRRGGGGRSGGGDGTGRSGGGNGTGRSGNEGPGNEGPGNEGPGNEGPGNEGPGNEGPGNEGPGNEGPGNEGPGNEGPGNEGPGNEGPGNEGPGNEGPGNEGPGNEGPGRRGAEPPTRAQRLAELSRDPDHGGQVTEASRAEAEAALGLEEAGEIPGPIRRPARGDGHSGDFVDGNEGDWDVKAPRSRQAIIDQIRRNAAARGRPEPNIDPNQPIRGEFNVNDTMAEIRGEIAANENVIIDTRNMNAADIAALRQAIANANLTGRVKFFPP